MKIWYQSYSTVGFDPKWDSYDKLLKRYLPKVTRPDTQVTTVGLKTIPNKLVECPYFHSLMLRQLVDNAIKAEKEGYDAYVIVGLLDPGYPQVYCVVDIPVLFSLQTVLHVACLLARRFGLVTPNEIVLRGEEELIKHYGLQERYAAGTTFTGEGYPFGFLELVKNPKPLIASFTESAREVIKRGAEIIVPGSGMTGGLLADHGIREIDGVPVLDIHATLIRMAETLGDLKKIGVFRSKKGLYYAPSKEELRETRKLFGVE